MKLMKNLYQVAGISLSHEFDATAYLVVGAEGLYLLDCGTPEGWEQILDNITRCGFAPEDIRAVYGTHGHYDHVGSAARWQERFQTKLYLHQADAARVETAAGEKTTAHLLYGKEFPPCQVAGTLTDGQKIDFGNQLSMEVLHTPGHTPGSVCFALDVAGYSLLIAGDTIWGGYSEEIDSDATAWKASLAKLTARHFDGYSFGHIGPVILADADTRLAEAEKQFGVYYNPWFRVMKETFRY